eukprot:9189782-Pyramimonas_sp.AAC.1
MGARRWRCSAACAARCRRFSAPLQGSARRCRPRYCKPAVVHRCGLARWPRRAARGRCLMSDAVLAAGIYTIR